MESDHHSEMWTFSQYASNQPHEFHDHCHQFLVRDCPQCQSPTQPCLQSQDE